MWKPSPLPSPAAPDSLAAFLREPTTRRVLLGMLTGYAAAFLVLVYCYPDPGWGGDSGAYVQSARRMKFSGYRPMGYSWFLNVIHPLSDSIYFVTGIQYVLQAASVVLFVLTVLYFFPPVRPVHGYAFAVLACFSPGGILMSRWIMSDPVFMALTLLWLATGIVLLHRRRAWLLLLHLALMYLAIETRYAGLVFPLVSALAFAWVYRARALVYAAGCLVVLAGAYLHGKHQNRSAVRIDTFSGFSGWAQANNAVAMIPYIDLKPADIGDPQLRFIHQMVTAYPDSFYRADIIMAVRFMWGRRFAGKQILYRVISREKMPYAKAWIATGVRLERYAKMLVRRYPLQYLRRFILPNIGQIFYPDTPLDDFASSHPIDKEVKRWYRSVLKDAFVTRYDYNEELILPITRPVNAALFGLMLGLTGVALARWRRFSLSPTQGAVLLFLALFLAGYLALSVLAHPVVMRYLLPLRPMMAATGYILVYGMLTGGRARGVKPMEDADGRVAAAPGPIEETV